MCASWEYGPVGYEGQLVCALAGYVDQLVCELSGNVEF